MGKRYVIVDFLHLAHRCIKASPLSATVMSGGEVVTVNTTIANGTIKNIWRYSGKGEYPIAVCLDGGSSRKEYFANGFEGTGGSSIAYKGGRENKGNPFFEGVNIATNLMLNGRVSLYRKAGIEADDLVYSLVQKIKSVDSVTPIDVVTNDSDLAPLVDEQVSVYIRGTREHTVDGCPKLRGYFQVTPATWDEYISYSSYYRDFELPYNSILLYKILKGDTSDNIPMAVKNFGPKKFRGFIETLKADGCPFDKVFRYGVDFKESIAPWVGKYFSPEEMQRIEFLYNGINLKNVPVVMPNVIVEAYLQKALDGVAINLGRS